MTRLDLKPADWVEIVIPTRNSELWVRQILRRFRALGVNPLYLVDTSSSDRTQHILRAENARIMPATLKAPRVEALIPEIRSFTAAPWVMRLDDDEFPSIALLKMLQGAPPPDEVFSVAMVRRWARLDKQDKLEFGYSTFWEDLTGAIGDDHQWRLFNPDKVTFTDQIHTPGFIKENWEKAPPEAFIVHFDWICRTAQERRDKLRGYDAQSPGSGEAFWFMYMPNRIARHGHYRAIAPPSDEFDVLAHQVCAKTTSSNWSRLKRGTLRAIGLG